MWRKAMPSPFQMGACVRVVVGGGRGVGGGGCGVGGRGAFRPQMVYAS